MPAISTPDVKSMLERNDDMLLVNTLPSDQFEATKLPTAVNIPQDQGDFVDKVEQQAGDKKKKVIVYCASMDCHSSTEAAKKLDEAGFVNILDYRGGFKAWEEDVVDEAARTTG